MATSSSYISTSPSTNLHLGHWNHVPHSVILSFPSPRIPNRNLRLVLRATGKVKSQGARDPPLLRRPLASDPSTEEGPAGSLVFGDGEEEEEEKEEKEEEEDADVVAAAESGTGRTGPGQRSSGIRKKEEWVDWEDLILEDTVPLASFVRMILHSGKYKSGDRLSSEHERIILERLLPYHSEFERKIGCGIDYITIGFHPEYEISRCLFIVRKDGELVDFSYWKCIKGLIRKKYPLYADNFIHRHFKRSR